VFSLARTRRLTAGEIVATISYLTVWAAAREVRRCSSVEDPLCVLYVSGGGARNGYFLSALRAELPAISVLTVERLGIPAKAIEAAAFAYLAYESATGHPANLPQVTGASRPLPLGKLTPPSGRAAR
ncbi:MAG: anhydro-N-acetylmuramic acid kinase, partial [Vicinamibacteria bacterium]